MKLAARTDQSQSKIVGELRAAKIEVVLLSALGRNVPDLLLFGGKGYVLAELKEETANAELKRGQLEFIANTRGYVGIVTSFKSALNLATEPERFAFNQKDKDKIAVFLSNWDGKRISVKSFYREVFNREL